MKTCLALVACLALVSVAFAEPHKKGKKHEEQVQAQGQGQGQGRKAQKFQAKKFQSPQVGTGNKLHGQKIQGQKLDAGPGGGPHVQSKKLSKQVAGKKFQAKQFKKFNLAKKQPNPNIPNVKFQAGLKIKGAHKWKGNKYVVFKNYSCEWHDHVWWHHHHSHIVFVFGGWYYWNSGYWFPAWGYAPDSFYAYEGPIYSGSVERDPGDVVANVQSALQEQGYYVGEVDGVLGPLTRAALAQYQQAIDIEPTGAIDEPTLESLGLV